MGSINSATSTALLQPAPISQNPPQTAQDQVQAATQANQWNQYLANLFQPWTSGAVTAETSAGITPSNYAYAPGMPERYGSVGNGTTNDTVAVNSAVAVMNAQAGQTVQWLNGKTYYVTTLNPITAANTTLIAYGATIKSAPITAPAQQMTISGANCIIRGLTINGNQSAFASSESNGLLITANNCTLEDVTITNCSAYGLTIDSYTTTNTTVTGGTLVNLTLSNNASWGFKFSNVANMTIVGLVSTQNGFGFQGSFTGLPSVGMGGITNFRSHHLTFMGCRSDQNGIDGLCTDQGSYAIKYIGCKAWMNGDAGFSLAADSTGTGRPGEGEACYDVEYIDCESYNNWAAGLSGESTIYNVTVLGGRYYNNGRGCGIQTIIASIPSGIYLNGSASQGFVIKAKCYDDRQMRPITANASGVLTATGWVAGTMSNYPRVALYNASLAFQGYATITAESSGSVTIATTAYNGVTVASVASGWYVSQRVQTNGFYSGIGNQGTIDIDGFGNLPGPAVDYGWKAVSYTSGSGQNIRNVNPELVSSPELLANPSWDSGTGSGTSWTYTLPTGASVGANSTAGEKLYSPAGIGLIGGTSAQASGVGTLITSGGNYLVDCWVEFSCIVYATVPGSAGIALGYGGSYATVVYHPGGGTRRLTVSGYLLGANTVTPEIFVQTGQEAWFDEASVKVKHEPIDNRDYSYPTRNLSV